jgi:hypothetical protein
MFPPPKLPPGWIFGCLVAAAPFSVVVYLLTHSGYWGVFTLVALGLIFTQIWVTVRQREWRRPW